MTNFPDLLCLVKDDASTDIVTSLFSYTHQCVLMTNN